jgi:hypothetical protein
MQDRNGRGDRIRTYDLLVPNQALYQTKLHPEGAYRIRRITSCQTSHPDNGVLGGSFLV